MCSFSTIIIIIAKIDKRKRNICFGVVMNKDVLFKVIV